MALKDQLTVTLQVALDSDPTAATPTWTTVASNTTGKLRSWKIDRGRNSTLDTFQAGTATFVLDNRDRLFDPLYTAGAYYGKLKPGKRVRLIVRYGGVDYTRFDGFVDGWPQTYPSPSVRDALVQLKATDGFKRLARTTSPSVYRQEVAADSPTGWYRLGETEGTVAVDASGHERHGTYEGGATFNTRVGLIAKDDDNGIGFDGVNDVVVIPTSAGVSGTDWAVEAWITHGEVDANDRVIWEQKSAGGQITTLALSGTTAPGAGSLFVQQVNSGTSNVVTTGTVRVDDDKPHHVVLRSSAALTQIYVDDALDATGPAFTAVAAAESITVGFGDAGNSLVAIAGTGLFAGIIDEVAIYSATLSTGRISAHYQAGTAPWAGDAPGTRITKVLDAAGWPAADRDLDAGSATLAAADLGGDVLAHLQAVAVTEGGRLFVSRGGELTLVGRVESWTESAYTTSQATFADDGTGVPYSGFGWDWSDSRVRNEIRINPQAGSERVAADATSQAEYGTLSYTQSSLEADLPTVASQAQWLLQRHKDAALEVDRLDVDPLRSPAAAFPVLLSAELGYRYTIKRTPQGVGSAISQEVQLEGTSEAGDSDGYRFSWQLSRAEPAVFIVGSSTIGGSARIGY